MIFSTPVDVVGVLVVLSRSVVIVVFVNTTGIVICTLASEVNTVMFGFTVVTPLLTVSGLAVVSLGRFLVVWLLETIANVVGVTFVDVLVNVTGPLVDILTDDRVESLELVLTVVFGAVVCFVD